MNETSVPIPAPSADESAGGASWLRWAPLLVVLVAWVAHESARQAGWILDDTRLVLDNPAVARGASGIPDILANGGLPETLESGASYGPLAISSFALEMSFWRSADGSLSPTGFHLGNLLLHGLCALLLFRLMLTLWPRRPLLALGAAVCFAAHPIHTGTVSALMGRADLLATALSLMSLLAWRAFGRGRTAWLPFAALFWLLALLAKEIVIGLPLLIILLDVALPPTGEDGQARRPPLAVYLVFLVPLLLFLWTGTNQTAGGPDLPAQALGARLLVGFEGLGRLMLLLLIPIGLRGDFSDEATPGIGYEIDASGWVVVALLGLLTLWVLWRMRRGRAGAFSLAWISTLALALPALALLPAGAALEMRFAYFVTLPLFALAGVLAEALFTLPARSGSFGVLRGAMAGALGVICLIGLTHREAQAWQNDEVFHDHLLELNPEHVGAMVRLARVQRRIATDLRGQASGLPSDNAERKRLLTRRVDVLEKALAWGRRATRHQLGRNSSAAWREMGFIHLARDDSALGLRALERARDLDPLLKNPELATAAETSAAQRRRAAEVYHAMGRAREALGNQQQAAADLLIASQLDESRVEYQEQAGLALCRVNRYAEGLRLLHGALRRTLESGARKRIQAAIDEARKSARRIAAKLLREGGTAQEAGEKRKAVTLYEQVLDVDPTSVEALLRAGLLRGRWFGDYEKARSYFREAETVLRQAEVPKNDETWRRLTGYRRLLNEQEAEEDAEERRLLEKERKEMEEERRRWREER